MSYLLEKSRVVTRGQNERSFHIFYQMIAALDDTRKKQYGLTRAEDYNYLKVSNCVTVTGMDDSKEFASTINALNILGFSAEDQDVIFRVCAAILHLGNVEFKGDETASITNINVIMDKVAPLLKVDGQTLAAAIVTPRVLAGKDLVTLQLSPQKAANSRDALVKALYGRMFLWVVDKINQTLRVQPKDNFIGILDIAGFEIFVNNSFEQLCTAFTPIISTNSHSP